MGKLVLDSAPAMDKVERNHNLVSNGPLPGPGGYIRKFEMLGGGQTMDFCDRMHEPQAFASIRRWVRAIQLV